ncbi:hypothetical protein BU24DRAFT_495014 [Aaosphaeria arxii CBS 175.79]|uniref:CFEM domain-containing protein n=1 Tax=Aaosphaeria arxii CBS 175.79 TaxID=1450172 RepID=A0A6A5XF87_9PLEO|nr:uncharacterized protein BU24DRAFT_495014 [Aaosphaeria arxii CBS 175.79]KAF2011905.1 hypothetical protein BU24DRAFT_495014 [Aaosphaeria arxii CBS 175.79]
MNPFLRKFALPGMLLLEFVFADNFCARVNSALSLPECTNKCLQNHRQNGICADDLRGFCHHPNGVRLYFAEFADCLLDSCKDDIDRENFIATFEAQCSLTQWPIRAIEGRFNDYLKIQVDSISEAEVSTIEASEPLPASIEKVTQKSHDPWTSIRTFITSSSPSSSSSSKELRSPPNLEQIQSVSQGESQGPQTRLSPRTVSSPPPPPPPIKPGVKAALIAGGVVACLAFVVASVCIWRRKPTDGDIESAPCACSSNSYVRDGEKEVVAGRTAVGGPEYAVSEVTRFDDASSVAPLRGESR